MGDPDGGTKVRFMRDFEMGTFEVTQLQYFLIENENPSYFKEGLRHCDNHMTD